MTISWIGWILSLVVLALLFLEGVILKDPVRLLITGKRAPGIIVGVDTTFRVEESSEERPMFSPVVEFVSSTGDQVRVTGRSYSHSTSFREGDPVTVLYNTSSPQDALLLLWREFIAAGFTLGFIVLIMLIWISGILMTGDSRLDDPLRLLPWFIDHARLHPVRFPILFIVSLAIPACGVGAYSFTRQAFDLHSQGIRVNGYVIGYKEAVSELSDGSKASGVFPMIRYTDGTGAMHTIRRSLAKPLSGLKPGDVVEVIYPAHHPSQGIVNTWDEFWLAPLFFGLMGLVFLLCFVLVLNGTIRI